MRHPKTISPIRCLKKKQFSAPSTRAKVSAAMVLFTILLIFLDCQMTGAYLPFSPTKNTIIPPCDPPSHKLPKDASLKETSLVLLRLPRLGNFSLTLFALNLFIGKVKVNTTSKEQSYCSFKLIYARL